MTSSQRPPSAQGSLSTPAHDCERTDDLQLRQNTHSHNHAHSHARLHHTHNHFHGSQDLHDRDLDSKVPQGQPPRPPTDGAPDDQVPYYTHVIQTIQLLYGTDSAGLPSVQTVTGAPATVVIDSHTGETIAAISAQDVAVTSPAPPPEPAASEAPPSEDVPPTLSAPLTTSVSSGLTNGDASSSSTESEAVTTDPVPTVSSASMVQPPNNATNTPLSGDSASLSATNSTIMRAFDFSTTSLPSTATTSRTASISHTTLSSFISSSSTTDLFTTTELDGGIVPSAGSGSGGGGQEDQAQPTADADSNDGDPLSPREKQIVGGVVGGVAGAAFFLLLIMLALRYKKRRHTHALEDSDAGAGSRGIAYGGGSGGVEMSQRSSMPAAVAAAFASLTRKHKAEPEPPPTSERGFYRVSGRKLQSVLQSGGDGYTNPHDSMASGHSDYYRGSQAFDPGTGPSNHLALGSPMRPTSGVMIMRDGPGRTPVTEQNPFADPPSPPPTRGPGTLGRSLPSQDGSGASGSRFREGI